MAATGIFRLSAMSFVGSGAKAIIGRDLEFPGYVNHNKILTGNIFVLILKKRWLVSHKAVSRDFPVTPSSLSALDLRKLQCVQNSLARIVTNTTNYSHITPVRKTLHLLPFERCSIFKTALLCTSSYTVAIQIL